MSVRTAMKGGRSLSARTGCTVGLLFIFGLLAAAPAAATYEQVGDFFSNEEGSLGNSKGAAVNTTGAGGVAAGTVYAGASGEGAFTYSAKGEFAGAWGAGAYTGIAVHQATGNVYVLRSNVNVDEEVVQVFTADGSQLITSFGQEGAGGETVDESPEKVHNYPYAGGIAVDSDGVVYVFDNGPLGKESRVMRFEPQTPGDYEHYVYAGRANDIAAERDGINYFPTHPVLDSAGNLYVTSEDNIYQFAPADPTTPKCEYPVAGGGVIGLTVNSESGEVFYFSEKNKKIHQLAPCNGQGEFVETTSFAPTPKSQIEALAFNPTIAWEASRPPGILYAVAKGKTETGPPQGYIFAPAEIHPPSVESQSVSSITSSTATLGAQINPKGSPTPYAFQYIPEAAWQANEPNEVQAVTVAAEGGTYSLTATTAIGAGKLTAGKTAITGVSADLGAFHVGDEISAPGIPAGTAIIELEPPGLGPGSLALSQGATETGEVSITATETTAPIPYDAPAAGPGSVQASLNALPGIATYQVSSTGVSVSGGPGDAAGSVPYALTFSGTDLAGADVPQLSADSSLLSGAAHTATVATVHEGGNGFSSGATEAPLGGAVLGSGQESLSAAVSLVGLEPDTEYHYRVIATSHCDPEKAEELCEDLGPDRAFHTFPTEAPGLPDNRAWELVSPAQKAGGEVFPADPATSSCGPECKPGKVRYTLPMQSAPDGEAVVYEGFPFSTTEGAAKFNEYLSRRTSSGWQTTILSPSLQGGTSGHQAFNTGLTQGLIYQANPTLTPEAPPEYPNLYTQPTATPSMLTPLLGFEPPNRPASGTGSFQLTYASASADFSRLFFEANDALTGETPFAPEAVDGGANNDNLYEWVNGQLHLVNVLPGNFETVPGAVFGSGAQLSETADFSHTISDDGSRVFWSDEAGQVYVREDGESTRAIPDLGKFLTASADGSEVLLSNGHLYDLETEEITDLTEGQGGFQGITGQSEDLSRIYFVDTAVLTGEEENDQGAKAQVGEYNLYAWHNGTAPFVATLDPKDKEIGFATEPAGAWNASPPRRTAEASPDGRWVAFLSSAPLTGYDNTGPCRFYFDKYIHGPCLEVFLYDSASGKLTCPSCNPSGQHPLGNSSLRPIYGAEGSIPQQRYLTDSGRLYFDTRDSLTSFDTNDGVEDVYQYEPEGVGSCQREGGCVSLISAGHEPIDSNFLAADVTGKNVFFTSRDQLVLKDRDDLIDLYVAREGGGPPAETEAPTPGCQGEACQPAVVVPNDPTPASSSFEGAGNVTKVPPARCSKGKVHRRGRCVKKRRHKPVHGRTAKRNRGGPR